MSSNRKIFISDCEGPISRNDNAFELASQFLPEGGEFFSRLSKYDDVLADLVKRPGYKAGDTLKLILPFFLAYGVTNEKIKKYSRENILLVPEASNTLNSVMNKMPSFIVSTSYEQYISSLCDLTNFPFENTYCTKLNLDKYTIDSKENGRLKELREEIVKVPLVEKPDSSSTSSFYGENRKFLERLDHIFWNEISGMKSGKIFEEVNPIGGYEKAKAVDDIVGKTNSQLSDVMYVGDSITDVEAFNKVRNGKGLTISFNGNNYAVEAAEIGVTSNSTFMIGYLAGLFFEEGKEYLLDCIDSAEKEIQVPRDTTIEVIRKQNMQEFSKHSNEFRKKVRGKFIGRLG